MKIKVKSKKEKGTRGKGKLCFFLILLPFAFCLLPLQGYADKESAHILAEMPIQHGGRVKPFQSFAREAALNITGSLNYDHQSAEELVWNWLAKPEEWNTRPMIQVPHVLRKDFGIMMVKNRISPELILNHKPFVEKVQEAASRQRQKEHLTNLEKKYMELYDRALLFQDIAAGAVPGWIAHPENPLAGWLALQELSPGTAKDNFLTSYPAEKTAAFMTAAGALVDAWRQDSASPQTAKATKDFYRTQRELFDSRGVYVDQKHLDVELLYNRFHAFGWAWKFYLLAAVIFGAALFFPEESSLRKKLSILAVSAWGTGFLIHLTGFVLRCIIAGRPPVTNMYESMIWVSWAAVFFSMILFAVYRAFLIPFTSALVASFALIVAETFPAMLDPAISPLVPVLRSNLWLSIHVLTITMSYGAFALAWGLGHAVVMGYARDPFNTKHLKNISAFLYRALQIGVILLASGTVLGGVWANYSWGRFWGWDPKETWALIALLGYLVVLHGRFAGWLDTFDAAASSVIAFAGIIMAWYGVNYVLAAGLHSYGFGGGGAPYVMAVALADIAVIVALRMVYKKKWDAGAKI